MEALKSERSVSRGKSRREKGGVAKWIIWLFRCTQSNDWLWSEHRAGGRGRKKVSNWKINPLAPIADRSSNNYKVGRLQSLARESMDIRRKKTTFVRHIEVSECYRLRRQNTCWSFNLVCKDWSVVTALFTLDPLSFRSNPSVHPSTCPYRHLALLPLSASLARLRQNFIRVLFALL